MSFTVRQRNMPPIEPSLFGDLSSTRAATHNQQSQKRRKISNEQRRALREFRRTSNPTPTHQDVIKWFAQKYDGHKITKSSVTDCISAKYDYLDATANGDEVKRHRDRGQKWPVLEDSLWEWVQRYLAAGSK